MNEVLVRHIQVDEERQASSPNAPVSYPHLWGITKHDRVQWNGIANNTKLAVGPLGRNVGEVLGVFGEVNVPRLLIDVTFESSVRFRNLLWLEDAVDELTAPKWEDVFGKLDEAKKAKGKELFVKHCLDCHNPKMENGFVRTTLTKIANVGTDPAMAKNFAQRVGKVGNMKGRLTKQKRFGLDIGVFKDEAPAGALLIGVVGRTILGADPEEFDDRVNLPQLLKDFRDLKNLALGKILKLKRMVEELEDSPYLDIAGKSEADLMVYRGRPLEGIWATAPYLHNGSVPNLYELLLPANERTAFKVGSREFDPVKVGFRTDKGMTFDITRPGNSNRGHDIYGRKDLDHPTDAAANRAALLEYLKSL